MRRLIGGERAGVVAREGHDGEAQCVVEGQTPPGSSNLYWVRVTDAHGSSFVHRDAITVAPDLRHC